jgi:hypothetical protein
MRKEFKVEVSAFIDEVRRAQLSHGKPLGGILGLDEASIFAVHCTAAEVFKRQKNDIISLGHIEQLGLRFEEICRRRKIDVKHRLRVGVLRHLTAELFSNHLAVEAEPSKLIPVTIYHGSIGASLPKLFPEFKDNIGILKRAMISFPFKPVAYLEKLQKDIVDLTEDDAFKELPRWVIVQASVNTSTEPREYLHRVLGNIHEIKNKQEFFSIAIHTPWMITRASVAYKDPDHILTDAQEQIEKLWLEFEGKATVPLLKRAIAHRPSDVRGLVNQKLNPPQSIPE